MKRPVRIVLCVLTGLIAINFLVMGLRWAVAPSGAAEALNMPLFSGAARSSQIGDVGSLFLCMGLFVLFGLVTKKREWFLATSLLVYIIAVFRILAWLFHGASLMMSLIVPEIVIATLLLIASQYLAASLPAKPQ